MEVVAMVLSGESDPIAEFWNAFLAREARLAHAIRQNDPASGEPLMHDLHRSLGNIDPALAFEFGRGESGRLDFCITPDGRLEAFERAAEVVDAAPKATQWNIFCFRERKNLATLEIRVGDVLVCADRIRYLAKFDDKVQVALFYDVPKDVDADALYAMSAVLLDATLGEYDSATSIVSLDVFNDDHPRAAPLIELRGAFDAWKEKIAN
jgi:hypothetical protein